MPNRLAAVVFGLTLVAGATAAVSEEASVAAPAGASLVLEALGQGVQIYACQQGASGYRWAFTAPEATLLDAAGRPIGTHFAGPSWQLEDGSKIVGTVAGQAPAAEPNAVAWLLLRVKAHEGAGVLSNVVLVRRVDTHGGIAPAAGCDAAHAGQEARVPYTAHYLFYTVAQ